MCIVNDYGLDETRPWAKPQFPNPSKHLPSQSGALDFKSLERQVQLPTLLTTNEERIRAKYYTLGQKLSQKGKWEQLSEEIRQADDSRLFTPGGECIALLLAAGASNDLVVEARESLRNRHAPDLMRLTKMEEALLNELDDYALALVAAVARLDFGAAWKKSTITDAMPEATRHARHHFLRALRILAPFDAVELDSPSLLATKCYLSKADAAPQKTLINTFLTLIEMDPDTQCHMRAFGRALVPTEGGLLEQNAQETARLTEAVWGQGGYTWVYLDALTRDKTALTRLNVSKFIQGMKDILNYQPDQHIINELAAFCAITMASSTNWSQPPKPEQEAARLRLHACTGWLLAMHMHELHPLLWAQTQIAPSPAQNHHSRKFQIARGRQIALEVIGSQFSVQLADGATLSFSPS